MEGSLLIDVFAYKICSHIQTMGDLKSILHASPALYRRRQSILAAFWRRMNPPAGRLWLVHATDGKLPGELALGDDRVGIHGCRELYGEVDIEPYIGEHLRVVFPTAKKLFFVPLDDITHACGIYMTSNRHDVFGFYVVGKNGWGLKIAWSDLVMPTLQVYTKLNEYLNDHGILLNYSPSRHRFGSDGEYESSSDVDE
jgi:hypothetical protein